MLVILITFQRCAEGGSGFGTKFIVMCREYIIYNWLGKDRYRQLGKSLLVAISCLQLTCGIQIYSNDLHVYIAKISDNQDT